jgi:hypothetical protein
LSASAESADGAHRILALAYVYERRVREGWCEPTRGCRFLINGGNVMGKLTALVTIISSILTATLLAASPAAARPIVHVDPVKGDISSGCGTAEAPCANLFTARERVDPFGTIILMTPGNYGAAGTFTFPVTIRGMPGAGIFISEANKRCLTFAGGTGDVLTISDLICDMGGFAEDGILVTSGGKLRLDNVTISRSRSDKCGVRVRPSSATASGVFELAIKNSSLTENGASGINSGGGVCILPTGTGNVFGVIDGTSLQNNRHGLISSATDSAKSRVLITNSDISGNTIGIKSQGSTSIVCVRNSSVAGNNTGITGTAQAQDAGNNTVFNNAAGSTFDDTCS